MSSSPPVGVSAATVMRHPLASKRYIMVFRQDGEESMEVFELLSRYEAVGPIGQGTYGFVCSARDNNLVEEFQLNPPPEYEDEDGETTLTTEEKEDLYDQSTLVAVKKLRQLFENNQPRMWLCATREIQLMMAFHHDNVMSASDFFIPLGGVESLNYASILHLQHSFDSVYVVMKKMDYTLREVLDSIVVTPREIAAAKAEAAAAEAEGDGSGEENAEVASVDDAEADGPTRFNADATPAETATATDSAPRGETNAGADSTEAPAPRADDTAADSYSDSLEENLDAALDIAIAKQVSLSSYAGSPNARQPSVGVFGALPLTPTIASAHTFGSSTVAGGANAFTASYTASSANTQEAATAAAAGASTATGGGGEKDVSTPAGTGAGRGSSSRQTTEDPTVAATEDSEDSPLIDPRTGLPLHPMQKDYRKFILYQILRGVGYLHRCPVIHRDLKPENVMLDRSYNTCITDFGQGRDVGVSTSTSYGNNASAAGGAAAAGTGKSPGESTTKRAASTTARKAAGTAGTRAPNDGPTTTAEDVLADESFMAEYVQTVLDNTTQWYAAPETLTLAVASTGVGFIDHETFHGLDVWSVGCIAAEMLTGRPLFYTTSLGGIGQLISIIDLLGEPRADVVSYICELRDRRNRDVFVAAISRVVEKFKGRTSVLREVLRSPYGDEDADEVELITRCLAWDPRERLTIQEALESPYFTKEGYEPVIDPEDTAKRVPAVRPEDISEPVSGRAFLWQLFVERHPEVGELWKSLKRKHMEEVEANRETSDVVMTPTSGGNDEDSTFGPGM